MASGVPVVAYPVPGPSDVVIQNRTGVLHEDLQRAALEALELGGEGGHRPCPPLLVAPLRGGVRHPDRAGGPSARSAPFG